MRTRARSPRPTRSHFRICPARTALPPNPFILIRSTTRYYRHAVLPRNDDGRLQGRHLLRRWQNPFHLHVRHDGRPAQPRRGGERHNAPPHRQESCAGRLLPGQRHRLGCVHVHRWPDDLQPPRSRHHQRSPRRDAQGRHDHEPRHLRHRHRRQLPRLERSGLANAKNRQPRPIRRSRHPAQAHPRRWALLGRLRVRRAGHDDGAVHPRRHRQDGQGAGDDLGPARAHRSQLVALRDDHRDDPVRGARRLRHQLPHDALLPLPQLHVTRVHVQGQRDQELHGMDHAPRDHQRPPDVRDHLLRGVPARRPRRHHQEAQVGVSSIKPSMKQMYSTR